MTAPSLKEVREALRPFAEAWNTLAKHPSFPTLCANLSLGQLGRLAAAETAGVHFRRAAALYDSLLTAEAEANVYAIRPWDAPGADVCVKEEKAELERLRPEKSNG